MLTAVADRLRAVARENDVVVRLGGDEFGILQRGAHLPEQAQAKLFARKSFRERITKHSLRLFDDSGMADVIGDTKLGELS